jgi:hypothetical protein
MDIAMTKWMYLDFDGVLQDDVVYWHPKRGIFMSTPNRTLFEWSHILEELVEPFPNVQIILSTSWVRVRSYEFAKSKLPISLQQRVVGATFHNREMQKIEFDHMPRWQQISSDAKRRNLQNWFAIDNDCRGWPEQYRDRLVLTNDRLGLSEESVQNQIREFLMQA